ncbi:MAG: phenylalanine--tRNA ligase subunit alpha [Actinobacteria bacterium]|nr:phenylalanine--tRNA ligase subunit alpha [Actinomycetota bacterium]
MAAGEVHFISQNTLERVSTTVTPQKVLGVFAMQIPDLSALVAMSPMHSSQSQWILVADRVADPGNLGTMIRSAVAAGASAIVLTPGTVDPYSPKVVRAAAGAIFSSVVFSSVSLSQLAEMKWPLLGTTSHEKLSPLAYDEVVLSSGIALVMGNEAAGIALDQPISQWITIPHHGPVDHYSSSLTSRESQFGYGHDRFMFCSRTAAKTPRFWCLRPLTSLSMTSPVPFVEQIAAVVDASLKTIAALTSSEEVAQATPGLVGKKSALSQLKSSMGSIADSEERKSAGQALHAAQTSVDAALAAKKSECEATEMAAQLLREQIDITEHLVAGTTRGRLHLVTQATQRLEDVFIGLGFQVAEGPEVESDFYNFEALNMPKSHPARSMWDTLFVESEEPGSVVLRTHTSPVQIRVMQNWPPPIYAIMPGRVFRRDTPDATHMPVFHQIEGLVIDRNITFKDLAGTIEAFTKAFFGDDFTSRLRPSYFPFTEPSAEFDIRRANGSWIELGGCGMVHPDVLRAGGLDPEEWSGFAFGFGIDRMAKERHNVEDIREMYTNDLRFLRQFSS